MSTQRLRRGFSLAFFALSLTAVTAAAPIYMKVDGVEGDVARGSEKWIKGDSWHFAPDRQGNPSCASQSGSFTVSVDSKGLPELAKAARSRKTFREITIDADGEMHTLQAVRIHKVDSFTVKQKVIDLSFDRCLTHSKGSSKKK